MDQRYAIGPPGAAGPGGLPGSPFDGPGSPFGPYGQGVPPGQGPSPSTPSSTLGNAPLLKRVERLDESRLAAFTELASEVHNSLIHWGILKLRANQPNSRKWIIDPTASPVFPGGGLTVRANTPGTYGTFT